MMSAKWIKKVQTTSRLSNLVKTRRNRWILRNRRSTSLRFLYRSRSYAHDAIRLAFDGTHGFPSPTCNPRTGFVPFIGLVPHQTTCGIRQYHAVPQLASLEPVALLPSGRGEPHGASILRSYPMKLGGPSPKAIPR